MKQHIPRTPFSTRFSGSAKETELRIRNIFQWKKQRPPVWLMALVLLVIFSCGGLVSCQPRQDGPEADAEAQRLSSAPSAPDLDETALAERLARRALGEDFDALAAPELTVLLSRSQGDRTLLLVRVTNAARAFGWDNLFLGVYDREAQDFTGEVYRVGGDQGLFSAWEESGSLYLLCTNNSTDPFGEEVSCPGFFRFDGVTLEQIGALPQIARDSPLRPPATMEEWYQSGDFKFIASPGGLEVYARNPAWSFEADPSLPQWTYLGFVPFTEELVDDVPPAVRAAAREYRDSTLWDGFPAAGAPITLLEKTVEWTDLTGLSLAPAWQGREDLSVVCYRVSLDPLSSEYVEYVREAQLVFLRAGEEYTYLNYFLEYNFDPSLCQPTRAASLASYNRCAVLTLYANNVLTALPDPEDLLFQTPAPQQVWDLLQTYAQTVLGEAVSSPFRPAEADPRENDLRLDALEPRLWYPVDSYYGVLVYRLESSRYQAGRWQPEENRLFFLVTSSTDFFNDWMDLRAESSVSDLERAAQECFWGLEDLDAALWEPLYTPASPIGLGPQRSWYLTPTSQEYEDGVLVYEEGDRYQARFALDERGRRCVTYLDTTRRLPTIRGVRVGSSRAEVLAAYPDIRDGSRDAYREYQGDYLWYCADPEGNGPALLFFFTGDTVSRVVLDGTPD